MDRLGPRAGRRVRPRHGRRPGRREPRLRGVPRRPGDGEQRPDPQREPVLGPRHLGLSKPWRPVGDGVRQPRRHALRVAARVVFPRRRPAAALPGAADEHAGFSFRGTPRTDLMAAETGANRQLSYSSSGPRELWPGVSNYVLQVHSRRRTRDDDHVPALLMYFLDSGGGSYTEVVSSAQVKWFQSQSQFLNPNGRIPELIFWHIPSTAYVMVGPKAKSEIRKPCVGSINKEEVAPQAAEWGMMDALAKRPSVKAVFVGHNHGLDWCCPYEELWLCFARHTGYGGYGDWPKGARIIQVTEDPFSAVSWIRMENGSRHSDVTLSS
ncbi:probable inactive purple acid phosphatase 16 isoform X2 [Miscanthus floridulus]|uniref:probable inactive purple acid phosphatase 16 isoform X2 n=1 Tax=Miscanthus floridulus TaxID=154761 RepID=UPI00345A7EA5